MSRYNFTIQQGATFNRVITYKDPDGDPINLTDMEARMQIRPTYGGDVIHELTTDDGGIALGGAAGTITLNIDADDTETFDFDTALYDLELVNADEVTRLLEGTIVLSKEVTKEETPEA